MALQGGREMFNPEKLLGGLLKGAMGKGGVGLGAKGAVGLGILGVAMEAAEHFMNRSPDGTGGGPNFGPSPGMPPPPPGTRTVSVPPPPPGAPRVVPPAPPMGVGRVEPRSMASETPDAVLLIRAMIAAANADGVIDADERRRILERLEVVGLDKEEKAFIAQELLCPADLEGIVSAVKSPEMAGHVYAVSLAAVRVDTEAERSYMDRLAQRLGMTEAAVAKVREDVGLESR